MLFDAVRAGAKGWLLKDVSLERLTGAIRTLADGGTCIEPVITERIMRALEKQQRRRSSPPTSPSRSPTARRPSSASSPAATATARSRELLNITEGTVKNHISSVLVEARRARSDAGGAEGDRSRVHIIASRQRHLKVHSK